jgi:predicted AAA+ superfamily ATPase
MVNTLKDDVLRGVAAEWLERSPASNLIPRDVVLDLTSNAFITAVVGPRRAGKTSLMLHAADTLIRSRKAVRSDFLFVDFEDYRLQGFVPQDIDRLLTAFNQLTGHHPRFLFFDEIQHLPAWSRVLRTLHNQRRYRIVVTGSNSELLSREIATELRGRYLDVLMLPFSFQEYLVFHSIPFDSVTVHTPSRGRILKAFEAYLQEGGFPEVVANTDPIIKRQLLQTYYGTIFYKDILERHAVKARSILDRMMSYALDSYASLFSISAFEKMLKSAGLSGSKRTIANYLHYLEEAFFLVLVEKFSYSPRTRAMNPRKAYLIDPGFAGLGVPFSTNRGRLLENMVAVELYRRKQEFFFHKERQECDFVFKSGTKPVLAAQVCWEITPQNEARELNGLLEALTAWKIKDGLILTANQETERVVERRKIRIQPVWKWALGQK